MRAAERRHLDRVAALGCCICGAPAEIHHVRRHGAKRDHMRAIPLCPRHHRTGGHGVAVHAGRQTWAAKHGTEERHLAAVMRRLGYNVVEDEPQLPE